MKWWKQVALAASGLLVAYGVWTTWNQLFEVEAEPKLTYKHVDGKAFSFNYLLEIPIYGEMMVEASDPSLYWSNEVTYSVHIQKLLKQASTDSRIKGILLRLNTGGGSGAAAGAIYQALMDYRKATQKPIIAHIEETSASAGVEAMMGAEAIYAAPGSFIGSIGIVSARFTTYDKPSSYTTETSDGGSITSDSGVEQIVIFAGNGKDLGYSNRKPTDAERKMLRQSIKDDYDDFVLLVAKTRNIPEKTIREKIGAYMFGNKQAEKLNLIDGTKSRTEAIADLAKRAKVGDDFRVVRAKAPNDTPSWFSGVRQELTFDQKQQMLNRDRCATASNKVLAYHGNPQSLCQGRK